MLAFRIPHPGHAVRDVRGRQVGALERLMDHLSGEDRILNIRLNSIVFNLLKTEFCNFSENFAGLEKLFNSSGPKVDFQMGA